MVLERAFPAPHDLVPRMEQSMFVAHNQTNGTTTTTTVMTPANVTSLPIGNTTSVPVIRPPCQWILYQEIHNSRYVNDLVKAPVKPRLVMDKLLGSTLVYFHNVCVIQAVA